MGGQVILHNAMLIFTVAMRNALSAGITILTIGSVGRAVSN